MKLSALFIFILVSIFYLSQIKEPFEDMCRKNTDCASCAENSGCGWCPKANLCIHTKNLLSTDECNQMNVMTSSFSCSSKPSETYDLSEYKNQIGNKFPPPNVYMGERIAYSNEDVVSSGNNVRNDIQNMRQELPNIIAISVEGSIKPMVKDIIQDNIQGFQDMNIYFKFI